LSRITPEQSAITRDGKNRGVVTSGAGTPLVVHGWFKTRSALLEFRVKIAAHLDRSSGWVAASARPCAGPYPCGGGSPRPGRGQFSPLQNTSPPDARSRTR